MTHVFMHSGYCIIYNYVWGHIKIIKMELNDQNDELELQI